VLTLERENKMKSTITIKRDHTTVTLIVDGRVSKKEFFAESEAKDCYEEYLSLINSAENG